jgi:hypothetical protein
MWVGRREALLLLLLALAPLAAYAPPLLEGRLLAPGEGAALHLPLRVEAWRALARGEVPSWNPSIFSGTPLLAAYRPGALHPLMVALAPLAPFVAFQVLVLTSLALVGPLLFVYMRRLGAEWIGALVAALSFVLGPYLVAHLGDTATLVAAPALLLALLAAEDHLARGRRMALPVMAAAIALLLLAGSPAAVGALVLLLGTRLFVGFVPPLSRWTRGAPEGSRSPGSPLPVLLAVLAGLLLAAPQVVPTLIALAEAGSGGPGSAAPLPHPLAGVAGLVVHYVSHSPAPAFALASVPLVARWPAVRPIVAILGVSTLLMALRGPTASEGAVLLAFDVSLSMLAGLSLSAQWSTRLEAGGRRLRQLALVAALASATALSVATTVTGPLASELAAPVGLLALALILYFALAQTRDPVAARVFVLPLVASLLLQPWGRQAWAGAPHPSDLLEGTPTREAVDRLMGARRTERTLTLAETWPRQREADLAWGDLATFAGRRNANGYDPLVPASRRRVLEGMGADGTLPRRLLDTDPGRLELLGVRWIQVPTSSLGVPADAEGLGDRLNVVLEEPRPHLFPLPFTRATEVRLVSFLTGSTSVEQGTIVAECVARLATGHEIWLPIRAGVDTAEWAYERPDVRRSIRHQRPRVHSSFPVRDGFLGHEYLGTLRLPGRFAVNALRFRSWPGAPPLWLLQAGLHDAETGRSTGVSVASAFVSDEVRLREAADTPLVGLFEVRRGIGPAWVVEALRRVPDATRLLDVLRSPTRLGVDARREAVATEADSRGVVLPPGSRSSPADVARARGGRLVVRAAGPGLLVLAEGYDAGWRARIDAETTRVLRVNGDRLGVVLPAGTHRVVLTYHARGLALGWVLSALGAAAVVLLAMPRRRLTVRRAPC